MEDVRDGMDQTLLARGSYYGGCSRGSPRPPLRALVAQCLPDRLRDRGGRAPAGALRVRLRDLAQSRGAGRGTLHGGVVRADDSVFYEVFALARPAHPLARVGSPFVCMIQRRFAASSLRAVAAAVDAGCSQAGGWPVYFHRNALP